MSFRAQGNHVEIVREKKSVLLKTTITLASKHTIRNTLLLLSRVLYPVLKRTV